MLAAFFLIYGAIAGRIERSLSRLFWIANGPRATEHRRGYICLGSR